MYGMLDQHARAAYARDRAETLRGVMLASQRLKTEDDAGRRRPARTVVFQPAQPRIHRGAAL
jgi:hypothetical protein